MTCIHEIAYESLPMRVRLRDGALADLPDELAYLGLSRPLILSTPGQAHLAHRVEQLLDGNAAGVFTEARMHVPVEIAERAVKLAQQVGADSYLAVGGGSTIGLGKAIALKSPLPIIAVPTTYAGSEMTPIWGLTEDGRKRTGRDRRVLPRSVVYDPQLTTDLPTDISVTSGLNAIAHAVEALYAPDASPIISLMAGRGIALFASTLPALVKSPSDADARRSALEAAWLCGACLGATTMGLHHKLCHVLGGTFDLPHAATHAAVLPYVAQFNLPWAPDAEQVVAHALKASDAATALFDLTSELGAPQNLAELGITLSDVDTIVTEVLAVPYANPRPVDETNLRELVESAINGRRPNP